MGKGNIDINPEPGFRATHPLFSELYANPALSQAFAHHERRANWAKRAYTALGLFSLVALLITMTSLIYGLVFPPGLGTGFNMALGWLGGFGIAAQIVLLATPLKRYWLTHRFASERLRGIKFRAFEHAAIDGEAAALSYSGKAMAALEIDLDKGYAALARFDPQALFREAAREPSVSLKKEELDELRGAFATLRIAYQKNHAVFCIDKIERERKIPALASEGSFWLGAALGYLDLVLTARGEEWLLTIEQRQFFTLFFFVISALLFALERGRSHGDSLDRYRQYESSLARADNLAPKAQTATAFVECVREAESAAMEELKAFCEESRRSTYIF